MDSDRPLVVDNGTGVSILSSIQDHRSLISPSSSKWVTQVPTFQNMVTLYLFIVYRQRTTNVFVIRIPFYRRSSHTSCRGTNWIFHHQRYHDRRRSSLSTQLPSNHSTLGTWNWEDMKHLWDHTFDEKLKINPQGRKVLLPEPPMNPRANRQRMCQVMFEDYGFSGVYVTIQAVLTLCAR